MSSNRKFPGASPPVLSTPLGGSERGPSVPAPTTSVAASGQPPGAGRAPAGQPVTDQRPPNPAVHAHAPRLVPRALRGGPALREAWLRAASLRPGCPLIVVSSADGGVGRSTVTAALSSVLGLACRRPPLAVDVTGRTWGGLGHRVLRRGGASIWDAHTALADVPHTDLCTVDSLTQAGVTGWHALLGETQRTTHRRPLVLDEAMRVVTAVQPHYPLAVLDAPVAELRGVWQLLAEADCPVLVGRASVDGLQHLMRLLAQLRAVDLGGVVDRAVVVVNATVPSPPREVRAGVHQLAGLVGDVIRLPWDAHLARPEPTDPARTRKPTRLALVELAAAVLRRCPADPQLSVALSAGSVDDRAEDTFGSSDGRTS